MRWGQSTNINRNHVYICSLFAIFDVFIPYISILPVIICETNVIILSNIKQKNNLMMI